MHIKQIIIQGFKRCVACFVYVASMCIVRMAITQFIVLGVARAWRIGSRLDPMLTFDTPTPATRSKP